MPMEVISEQPPGTSYFTMRKGPRVARSIVMDDKSAVAIHRTHSHWRNFVPAVHLPRVEGRAKSSISTLSTARRFPWRWSADQTSAKRSLEG